MSRKPSNAYFEEYGNLDLGYQMVALILLDEVESGEEIFADYGPMYHITSTPMSLITDEITTGDNGTPVDVAACGLLSEGADTASKQAYSWKCFIGRYTLQWTCGSG